MNGSQRREKGGGLLNKCRQRSELVPIFVEVTVYSLKQRHCLRDVSRHLDFFYPKFLIRGEGKRSTRAHDTAVNLVIHTR